MNTANTTTTRRRIDSLIASRASAQTRRGEIRIRSTTAFAQHLAASSAWPAPGPCRIAATSQADDASPRTATHSNTPNQVSKASGSQSRTELSR